MKIQRSVWIEEDVWQELIQQGFERTAAERRSVTVSELVRRAVHRELEALAGGADGLESYALPDGYEGAGA